MQSKLKQQKLTLLSVLLLILFSYPIISIANKHTLIAGFPILYIYIFVVWILAIALLYLITEGKQRKQDE
jgi:TRAP-type C4-dicarboxylate transport system permease small subunit